MIDNRLFALLHNVEHKGESLEVVATVLDEGIYKDALDWYKKYTGRNADDDHCYGCAELLYFLYQHDNLDFLAVEHFTKLQEVLCNKYGVSSKEIFSFLQDYRKLLLE